MTNTIIRTPRLNKTVYLAIAILLFSASLWAQETPEREKNDAIAAKYKNEHAVYTDYVTKLVFKQNEDGNLVANTYVTMKTLLISDLSVNSYNTDFFTYDDFNVLTDYSGIAYIPGKNGGYKTQDNCAFGEGGQVTGSFYDDVREVEAYYTGLSKGAVTETRYSLENVDIALLPKFIFQKGIPVVNETIEITVPDFVSINFVKKYLDNINVTQKKEEKDGKIIYTFTAKDLPALKSYNVPSVFYYAPHIIPYVASYRLTGAQKDSLVLKNTDAHYKYEYAHVKDLNIKLDKPLVKTIAEITKNDKTPREKATHIYKWVQQNIHYIAFEKGLEGFVPRAADTVFKRKYGDCKDMASLCMAMCRQTGLKAYFAIIGTWDLPYTNEELPSPAIFNHMICALKLDNDWVFLDGTDNIQPFGENRFDIQGKEALICIDQNNYKIVKIPVTPEDKSVITDSTFMHLFYGRVDGNIKQHCTGYPAWDIDRITDELKNEDRDKAIKALLARGANNYKQLKYNVTSNQTGDKDATITADFNLEDYAHKVGKEYIINMNLDRMFGNQRMNDSDRKVGYYFQNKAKTKEVVILDIPKGYKVTHLPAKAHGGLNGIWSYNISYRADKNRIVLTKEYELESLALSANEFAINNKVIDNLNHTYKESVVLTANK